MVLFNLINTAYDSIMGQFTDLDPKIWDDIHRVMNLVCLDEKIAVYNIIGHKLWQVFPNKFLVSITFQICQLISIPVQQVVLFNRLVHMRHELQA